jgi:hypothetical protein
MDVFGLPVKCLDPRGYGCFAAGATMLDFPGHQLNFMTKVDPIC